MAVLRHQLNQPGCPHHSRYIATGLWPGLYGINFHAPLGRRNQWVEIFTISSIHAIGGWVSSEDQCPFPPPHGNTHPPIPNYNDPPASPSRTDPTDAQAGPTIQFGNVWGLGTPIERRAESSVDAGHSTDETRGRGEISLFLGYISGKEHELQGWQ